MTDNPETANTEISMQELVQGIGRLIIKLNDSVVKVDKRLEDMEKGLSTLLDENFKAVTAELTRANELLSGIGGQVPAPAPAADDQAPAAVSGIDPQGLVTKLDEVKAELTGIREDLGKAQEKLLQALASGPEDSVDKKMFTDTLNDLSVMVSESSKSMEETITKVIGESGEKRDKILVENVEVLSQSISNWPRPSRAIGTHSRAKARIDKGRNRRRSRANARPAHRVARKVARSR